jgi:Omp85 superfamily domain
LLCEIGTLKYAAAYVVLLFMTILSVSPAMSDPAADPGQDNNDPGAKAPVGPLQLPAPPPHNPPWWKKWFDPATAPFLPVPLISQDPNSGTTVGLIPVWLTTNDNNDITRIIAPDVLYNPHFGFGTHGRIYSYESSDTQYSVTGGVKERVEREGDFEYQLGRLRESHWSINSSLIFDRSGTPRFYGIGNNTRNSAQTNYTAEHELAQIQVGFNLNRTWQLQYTARFQVIDVLPGSYSDVPSIYARFPTVDGLHTNREMLNRLGVVYDTRDDITIPSRGMKWEIFGGVAGDNGVFTDSLYTETGIDGRVFCPLSPDYIIAGHTELHYLLGSRPVPFWELSNLGGGESDIGGEQQLRSFGSGRYYDRDVFAASVELRHKVYTINAASTSLDIEVAPFIDVGRVFNSTSTSPIDHMHQAYGVGFRGIARPSVVGYVDVGVGSDGAAIFTGLNYPF